MTTKEMIAVMQAFDEGKQIQHRVTNRADFAWNDIICKPVWNFAEYDYRIKPEEPNLRPYANAEEFIQAQREHGMYFGVKGCWHIQGTILDNHGKVFVIGYEFDISTESLLEDGYMWYDGTPCGIIEEEKL